MNKEQMILVKKKYEILKIIQNTILEIQRLSELIDNDSDLKYAVLGIESTINVGFAYIKEKLTETIEDLEDWTLMS